jgi:hypothetical protein
MTLSESNINSTFPAITSITSFNIHSNALLSQEVKTSWRVGYKAWQLGAYVCNYSYIKKKTL